MKVSDFLTITELLKQSISKGFKFISGQEGKDNKITGVNIMDNPDAFNWLRPGELIITSGYFFKGSKATQEKAFNRFKELGIAGVCIKTDIYFKEMPTYLIELCNELQIPLIEIPYSAVFSDILNVVMENLAPSFDNQKQLKLDTQASFLEASLTMNGLDELATLLESFINHPILIINSNGRILGQGLLSKDLEKDFTPNDTVVLPYDLSEFINESPKHIHKTSHPILNSTTFNEKKLRYCLYPIFIKELNYGFIFIPILNKEMTNQDLVIISTSIMSLALEISYQFEKERSENKQKREFLITLLESTETVDLIMLLKKYNLSLDPHFSYKVINFKLDTRNNKNLTIDQNKFLLELLAIFENHININNVNSYCVKIGPSVVLLYGIPEERESEETEKRFINELIDLADYRLQQPDLVITSGRWSLLQDIRSSYEDTLALDAISQNSTKNIFSYSKNYYDLFLYQQISKKEAVSFYNYYLEKLLTFDQENKSYLTETLYTYLEESGNITQSAKRLFIHRNTLLYRIDKIETLLSVDLSKAEDSRPIELALILYYLHN